MRKLMLISSGLLLLAAAPALSVPNPADLKAIAEVEDRRAPNDSRFITWLKSPEPAVRARAALALGRIGAPASLPLLETALKDAAPQVRAQACFAVGLVADSSALDALAPMIHDSDPAVRGRAAEGLSRLGTRRAGPVLAAALRDPAREVVWEALTGFWRVQDSSGVDNALPLLADPDPRTRRLAVYSLERSHSFRAPAAVRPLTADSDAGVRMWAVRAIGRMKDVLGEPELLTAMKDTSWQVRVNALGSLGQLADSSRGPAVIEALKDPSPYVRRAAVDALGAMRFFGASPALAAMSADSVDAVRASAGAALVRVTGKSGYVAARKFLGDNSDYVKSITMDALAEVKAPDAWTYAAWAVENAGPRLRSSSLGYFGELKDGHGMPAVIKALEGKDELVAGNAADVIGDSGDTLRVDELVNFYDRWNGVEHAEARLSAVNAVSKLWPKHVVPFLYRALKDSDRRVRAAAAAGLKAAGEPAVPESVLKEPLGATARPGWFGKSATDLPERARVRTTRGDIAIQLERDLSPNTVANFADLAAKGYFNGIHWHRVVPNFVVQAGDPHGDGQGGPGYTIRCEMNPLGYETGRVGMALSGKDTGGSQFFITQSPQPHLNGRYTIFGRVLTGMDVVDRLDVDDRILGVELY